MRCQYLGSIVREVLLESGSIVIAVVPPITKATPPPEESWVAVNAAMSVKLSLFRTSGFEGRFNVQVPPPVPSTVNFQIPSFVILSLLIMYGARPPKM